MALMTAVTVEMLSVLSEKQVPAIPGEGYPRTQLHFVGGKVGGEQEEEKFGEMRLKGWGGGE